MWIVLGAVVICLAVIGLVILPPSKGEMAPFLDEEEKVVEGSISEKVFLDINDTTIGMFLVARDESKPILLFLGGGPGIPNIFLRSSILPVWKKSL